MHLILLLEKRLAGCCARWSPVADLTVAAKHYRLRPISEDDIVFYDWIVRADRLVLGLEIHLAPDHPLLDSVTPLSQLSYMELGAFPIIWFGDERRGRTSGLEAFGDIFFYSTQNHELAVAVGLEDWLKRDQTLNLQSQFPVAPTTSQR